MGEAPSLRLTSWHPRTQGPTLYDKRQDPHAILSLILDRHLQQQPCHVSHDAGESPRELTKRSPVSCRGPLI
jgi:hypothetical protein